MLPLLAALLVSAEPTRTWPELPPPTKLVTIAKAPNEDEAFLLQSVAGLVGRAARLGSTKDRVWIPVAHPAYDLWLAGLRAKFALPEPTIDADVWALADRYRKEGIVKGYILFRRDRTNRGYHEDGPFDPSVSVATSLCGRLGALLVSEEIEPEALARGYRRLLDAREMTEEDAFELDTERYSKRMIALAEPKVAHTRAEAITWDAFVMRGPGELYERALARLHPDAAVLGWGPGHENVFTDAGSRFGAFQTASNWSVNLPALASGKAEYLRAPYVPDVWDLEWEDGVQYASFVMSDGDNLQWHMGDFPFASNKAYWNNPRRGEFPMGWTYCYLDLAQACPPALHHLFETATPNDELILMSGGYFYPDRYGLEKPAARRLRAERVGAAMRQSGQKAAMFLAYQWDAPATLRMARAYAREWPDLAGILAISYSPYTAGKGAAAWVRTAGGDMPVLSAKYSLWRDLVTDNDGTPGVTAERINRLPHAGQPEDESRFCWVTVHAWSVFGDPALGPESGEGADPGPTGGVGLNPVAWCVERLEPHVRVLRPTELLLQMRLRLRSQETLANALGELSRKGFDVTEATRALERGDYREAFEMGKRAARAAGGRGA